MSSAPPPGDGSPAERPSEQPAPYRDFGGSPGTYGNAPQQGGPYPGYPINPASGSPRTSTEARPGTVTTALILTWIGAGIFALLGGIAVVLADNPSLLDGIEQSIGQQIDEQTVVGLLRGLGALMVVWGLAAILAAVFAWRGRSWARIMLTVMGVMYGLFLLLSLAQGNPASVVGFVWVAGCVALLWTSSAKQWYATRSRAATSGYDQRPPQPW